MTAAVSPATLLDDGRLGVVVLAEAAGVATETATRFALAGHHVVLGALNTHFADAQAQRLRDTGASVFAHGLNLSDLASITEFANTAAYLVAKVDFLIIEPVTVAGDRTEALTIATGCHGRTEIELLGIQHLAAQLVDRTGADAGSDLTVVTFTPRHGQWQSHVSVRSDFSVALHDWACRRESAGAAAAAERAGGCVNTTDPDTTQTFLDEWQASITKPSTHTDAGLQPGRETDWPSCGCTEHTSERLTAWSPNWSATSHGDRIPLAQPAHMLPS